MYLRENIKTLRKIKNLTQEELAERTGIKVKNIGAYEEGRATPRIETLCKLSQCFEVTIDELVKSQFFYQ